MNRIPFGYANAIQAAMDSVPDAILDLIHVDFLCGVDPVWAGLHSFKFTSDGRSYRDTGAYVPPHLAEIQTRPTIVMPHPLWPAEIVHELGHALHETQGWRHTAKPCTQYAKRNRHEAYAEAFMAWCGWSWKYEPNQWDTAARDEATVAHFDALLVA